MPAIISGQRISDADLERIGNDNPGWRFERADDGALIVSPTATLEGSKNAEALGQVYAYAKRAGGTVFDSSTGFKTRAGGIVSPSASWMRADRLATFAEDAGFWATMPDVVIEVASKTDWWPRLTAKIDKYECDGAAYAIAIDPATRQTYERGRRPADLNLDIGAILDA